MRPSVAFFVLFTCSTAAVKKVIWARVSKTGYDKFESRYNNCGATRISPQIRDNEKLLYHTLHCGENWTSLMLIPIKNSSDLKGEMNAVCDGFVQKIKKVEGAKGISADDYVLKLECQCHDNGLSSVSVEKVTSASSEMQKGSKTLGTNSSEGNNAEKTVFASNTTEKVVRWSRPNTPRPDLEKPSSSVIDENSVGTVKKKNANVAMKIHSSNAANETVSSVDWFFRVLCAKNDCKRYGIGWTWFPLFNSFWLPTWLIWTIAISLAIVALLILMIICCRRRRKKEATIRRSRERHLRSQEERALLMQPSRPPMYRRSRSPPPERLLSPPPSISAPHQLLPSRLPVTQRDYAYQNVHDVSPTYETPGRSHAWAEFFGSSPKSTSQRHTPPDEISPKEQYDMPLHPNSAPKAQGRNRSASDESSDE